MNNHSFGCDFGSYHLKIYNRDADGYLMQHNMVAVQDKNTLLACGDEAYAMYEKAPENINVSFPVTGGVIADYNNMQTMVQEVVETSNSRYSAMMKNFQDFYDTIISNRQELAPETASVKEETEETTEEPETDDQQ